MPRPNSRYALTSGTKRRRLLDRDRSTRTYGFSRKYLRIARGIRTAGAGSTEPIFSECAALPQIPANSGGVFTAQMSVLPQLADYAALYRTYRILKFEYILMPDTPVNTATGGSVTTTPRLVVSWDNSAEVSNPANEQSVLNDDGARIYMLNKPLRLVASNPKARVTIGGGSGAGGTVGVDLGRQNWLSFDDGSGIPHNGMVYWLSSTLASGGINTYVKITFQCRDPR